MENAHIPTPEVFAQLGEAGTPMRTVRLEVRRREHITTRHAKSGPIPSNYEAKWQGRWRRILISSGPVPHTLRTKTETIRLTVSAAR